ncbi:DUF6505 family protein [Algicella marina]|uniref:Uncharacterized protein n=1 Tax=Algicella marina TaxID=2683284 RepID=A0A6P1T3M2_9RHOB|nr:DUF6505 family protein [Algicella marina]QHQ37338.1 hypothetical protein GO499_08795 [Algicella marina]
MKLARTIRFDESDENVFSRPAEPGEWAIPGGFEFSNWGEADLVGKARQAFANGWLGLGSFGRSTFVAVAKIEQNELDSLKNKLSEHFVRVYGAPSVEVAREVAAGEIAFMTELAEDHAPNTLLTVSRSLTEAGVSEAFRAISPAEADIDIVAVHGTLD